MSAIAGSISSEERNVLSVTPGIRFGSPWRIQIFCGPTDLSKASLLISDVFVVMSGGARLPSGSAPLPASPSGSEDGWLRGRKRRRTSNSPSGEGESFVLPDLGRVSLFLLRVLVP